LYYNSLTAYRWLKLKYLIVVMTCVCVCVCIWACRSCGAMLLESALYSCVVQVTIDIQTSEVMG